MELFANNIKIPFGETLSIKFYNPLFNDIGSHSLPITVSAKIPSVNKAFGFPTRQEGQAPEAISANIRSGIVDLIGSWDVNDCSDKSIEAHYRGGNGDFYSMIKERLLTGLSFGGIKYPAGVGADAETVMAYLTTKMNASYPADDWAVFMAYLPDTVDGSNSEVNPILHVNPTGAPYFHAPADLNSTVYLFAGAVIDYIFSEYGYRIEENIFRTDPDLKKLVIFNTFNRATNFLDAFDYTELVPRILISDFLKAIRDRFNIGFFVNEHARSVKILSFDSIVQGVRHSIELPLAYKVNKKRISGISFEVNAPDTWSGNAFASLAEMDPSGTLVTVDKTNDIDIGEASKKVFVKSESAFYDVSAMGVGTRIGPDQLPYIEGSTPELVVQYSGIPGMYTINKNFETAVEYTVPYCDLKSNNTGYPYTDFPLMFLMAHGVQDCQVYYLPGAYERQYPMGSTDIYNAKGAAITGATLRLKWDGTNGIIERFWANRINWELNLKRVITTAPRGEYLNSLIDFSKIHRGGDNNYLVNSITAELTGKIVRIKEAELFRL